MEEYVLETRGISKRYKKTWAVRDLSMAVRKHSVYGLLGPNGAGKSTLLKMLAGILRPESGEIIFHGHPWTRRDLQKTGALIEAPALYGNLMALENLRVRAILLGIEEKKCSEILQRMDLVDARNKKISEFSLGMKQRLGIGLALLNNPRLLLLDEPGNGLDPFGMEKLRAMIRQLARSGTSVIVSSHILSEVEQVADDIGILYQGKLLYQDTVSGKEDLEQLFLETVRKEANAE